MIEYIISIALFVHPASALDLYEDRLFPVRLESRCEITLEARAPRNKPIKVNHPKLPVWEPGDIMRPSAALFPKPEEIEHARP